MSREIDSFVQYLAKMIGHCGVAVMREMASHQKNIMSIMSSSSEKHLASSLLGF